MKNFFGEKPFNVEIGPITAFGIPITSRYNSSKEIVEMLRFSEALALANANQFVTSIFYDGKSCCCSFDLAPGVSWFDPIGRKIDEAAEMTLSQYSFADGVKHGKTLSPLKITPWEQSID